MLTFFIKNIINKLGSVYRDCRDSINNKTLAVYTAISCSLLGDSLSYAQDNRGEGGSINYIPGAIMIAALGIGGNMITANKENSGKIQRGIGLGISLAGCAFAVYAYGFK